MHSARSARSKFPRHANQLFGVPAIALQVPQPQETCQRYSGAKGKCRGEIFDALEGRTTPHGQNLRFFIPGNAARRRPNVTLMPYPPRACFISGSLPSSLSQRLLHVVGCTRLLHFSENSIFGVPASAGNAPLHNCTLPRFRANNNASSLSLTRAPSSYTCFEWFPPQCRP